MTEGGKGDLGARTVYCGNLAWKVGWQDLKDFFSENDIGDVEHAEVLEYQDGRKTGSGVVRFKTADDAQKAIAELNDKPLKGRAIFLREDNKGGKGPGSKKGKGLSEDAAAAQVYVGNLSYHTSWQNLKDFMAEVGEIEYCDILRDRDGRSAGAGLVRYKDKANAQRAIEELNDCDCEGRKVFVREDREGRRIEGKSSKGKGKDSFGKGGKGKGKGGKGRKGEVEVEIKFLGGDVTWKNLKDEFAEHGCVHTEVNSGTATLKFASKEDAEAMIEATWHKACLGCDAIEPELK